MARIAWFFAIALGFTWALQLPAVFSERWLALAGLGGFGPLFAALVLARGEPDGVRTLFRRLAIVRVGWYWYPIALFLPGAILMAAMAVRSLVHPDGTPWLYPPTNAQRVVAMLLVPVVEEIGWRGYAFPRMQARLGTMRAALVLGVLWALWHVPMLLLQQVPLGLFPWMLIFFVAGSVTFAWIYQHTRGSLLLMVVAHMGAHLDNSHAALPGNAGPFLWQTAGYVVVAALLVTIDRRAFFERAKIDA